MAGDLLCGRCRSTRKPGTGGRGSRSPARRDIAWSRAPPWRGPDWATLGVTLSDLAAGMWPLPTTTPTILSGCGRLARPPLPTVHIRTTMPLEVARGVVPPLAPISPAPHSSRAAHTLLYLYLLHNRTSYIQPHRSRISLTVSHFKQFFINFTDIFILWSRVYTPNIIDKFCIMLMTNWCRGNMLIASVAKYKLVLQFWRQNANHIPYRMYMYVLPWKRKLKNAPERCK